MARRPVRMAPRAERFFLAEISRISDENRVAAQSLLQRMDVLVLNLSLFPNMGVPGTLPGTRRIYLHPFVLTIRVRAEEIEIAAMRHGRQKDARSPSDLR